ncbi:MAG: PhoH family protein [Bacteroidetes bacterium]|nr:PhoH family protein [Bacteroidota bacterium]
MTTKNSKKQKKIFVFDTNVILHDSDCIHHFEEHDIIVPVAVLEELDAFKKGNDAINFHAREFTRTVDALASNHLFNGGVSRGKGLGKISVHLDKKFHPDLVGNFSPLKTDHKILNVAYTIAIEKKPRPVILVTKDVNLRMKAKAVGLLAEDYKSDQVLDIFSLYKGHRYEENIKEEIITKLYSEFGVEISKFSFKNKIQPNEYVLLKNGKHSGLSTYNANNKVLQKVDKSTAYGIQPKNVEQVFALDALLNPNIQLVSLTGKAGTGKTLLALASALEQRKFYRQIYIARPIIPLSNRDIGFLPGDVQSKIDPYMKPLMDNLSVIQNQYKETDNNYTRISQMLESHKLIIEPLTYIRGRSLVKIFFIIDEAQNLTPHEIKTVITRAGEGTKIVFTGDIFQIDHPYLDSHTNGLSYLIEKMQGQNLYAHVNLEKGERSVLADLASNIL